MTTPLINNILDESALPRIRADPPTTLSEISRIRDLLCSMTDDNATENLAEILSIFEKLNDYSINY